jgi:hypothetical protein
MEATFHDGTTINVHNVIVLARKSQKIKGRAATSIESQDEDARDWAEEQELNVTATIADIISGKKAMWDRPNAKPWVTQPELMVKYQGIVASNMSRLTRADWLLEKELREWAEQHHIALYLVEKDLRWPPRPGAHYNDDVKRWNDEADASNREWNTTSRRWKRGHKTRESNNHLTGKAPFGYRIIGVTCKKAPCRCYENDEDDNKQLTIYEPEAKIVRDVVTRYLSGESTESICKDYPRWVPSSLARFLRSPAIAGRRVSREVKDKDGKVIEPSRTVLRYDGIISWQQHLEIVARLDSRAHRKGISPANSYMLTGIIECNAGHAMYAAKGGGRWYLYSCRQCGFGIRVNLADAAVAEAVLADYGDEPRMIKRIIPGRNHFEDIARLRQDRDGVQAEMDAAIDRGQDPAPYQARYIKINADIRRLTKLDQEHPEPDTIGWVKNGKTVAQHWESLDNAGRRDWLKENGWKVTATKDSETPDGCRLAIDPGWTAEISGERQAQSLGFPIHEAIRELAELPERLGINRKG